MVSWPRKFLGKASSGDGQPSSAMKERITFVHPPGAGIDPKLIEIQDAGLLGPPVTTTREDRLTIPVGQLPTKIADALQQVASLHVKWASPVSYDTLDPFSSRISPGLHISYSPLQDETNDPKKICHLLQAAFGPLKCDTTEAFTSPQTTAGAASKTYYAYQEVDGLSHLVTHLATTYCPQADPVCQSRSRSLYTAASLDLSYDASLQTVKVTTFWPLFEQSIAVPSSTECRTEVGVMGLDAPPNLQPHELGVSGLLTVLLEQQKPSPVLFGFPARHRHLDASFSSEFLAPTGLHPSLQIRISSNQPPETESTCIPHAYLTLPKYIFADRYQLADGLFLASKNLTAAPYTSMPVDLEAPAYTTPVWGSNVLLELAPPATGADPTAWTAEIPLHLRYLEPSESGHREVKVPYPAVFWACAPGTDADFSASPFDRTNLGYDGLFEQGTTFWHVNPKPESGDSTMSKITVPVLSQDADQWVGIGTSVAIALGFAWVMWKCMRGYGEHGVGDGRVRPPIKKNPGSRM